MNHTRPDARRAHRPHLEQLEDRTLPSTVTVDTGQVVRPVDAHLLGVNLGWWDSALTTSQTQQMVQAAGLNFFRFPGGSSADTWHFNESPSAAGEGSAATMARFVAALNGAGMVTLNYGTGSPQESAAFLAYLNAAVGDPTVVGPGPQWDDAAGAWVQRDWQTAGYWAGLRAAAPLARDDGLNFLRIGRSAPFAIHYFEVGNEVYGSWETDRHATPHNPATYVQFVRQFAAYAARIDPTITIGIDGSGTGVSYSQIPGNWTAQVLGECARQGFVPGFVSDHNYMFDPGNESDAGLLLHTATDPNAVGYGGPINWAGRAAAYRALLNQYLGTAAAKVQLLATEVNSISYDPTNQTTSLVNGLWLADALGGLMQTEYTGALVWTLRGDYDTSYYDPQFYGWRKGGDYGIIGRDQAAAPATGAYVPYPTYFAEQLFAKLAGAGGSVVRVASDDPMLAAYAVRQPNGHLEVLLLNKNPGADVTAQLQTPGFTPAGQATVWQYGEAQDTAQSQTSDGHSALANFTQALTVSGSAFSLRVPQYSMTVLDLTPAPAAPTPAPTALPSGWSDDDIGAPAKPGGTVAAATWTVSGGGAGLGATSDQLHFTHAALTGEGSAVARLTGPPGGSPSARVGVMLRDGTGARAAFAAVLAGPGNGVVFQWRTATGAPSGYVVLTGLTGLAWVKLTRSGSNLAAYWSSDGLTWRPVGAARAVPLPATVQAGVVVTALDNSKLATATLANVAVQAGFTTALARAGWAASASTSAAGAAPAYVLDGNAATSWRAAAAQVPGQWFQVDLGRSQTFQRIVLASAAGDYPRGYAVYVSDTGTDWSRQTLAATGQGTAGTTVITLPVAVTKRYVRVVLTTSAPSAWGIQELNLFV